MFFYDNSFERFISVSKEKRIIAFGASNYLKYAYQPYPELQLGKCIEYVVDNNENKWNDYFLLGEKTIAIHSPQRIFQENSDGIVILITSCEYAYDIYIELESYESLENVGCFVLPLMIMEHSDKQPFDLRQIGEKEEMIPKIIHCFWFSDDKKDELSQRCLDSWKETNPDYEIMEWNAHNYDINKSTYMREAFKNRKWAFVSDYARMDVIREYGGFYFDLDVELYKSLNEIRNHKMVIGYGIDRGIEGAAFGAQKDCEIIREVLAIYENLEFNLEKIKQGEIQPFYLGKVFDKKGFVRDGRLQIRDGICILPKEFFSNKNFNTGEVVRDDCSIGVHHYAGSWKDDKSKEHMRRTKEQMLKIKKIYEESCLC